MREIKFRGWHTKLQKMFPAEEMAADQLTLLPTGSFINVSGESTKFSVIYPRDKFIPLQYTGLKDKNGKEIYEGDIVRVELGHILNKVSWEDGQFVLKWSDNHTNIRLGQNLADIHEVIGNIYENPELLEVKCQP